MLGAMALIAGTNACVGEFNEHLPEGEATGETAAAGPEGPAPGSAALHFDTDIQKDLDAYTCTQSACHGTGMGNFKLVPNATGADLAANYDNVKARASAGEASKFLTRPTGQEPHTGGIRFTKADATYTKWLNWINQGAPR